MTLTFPIADIHNEVIKTAEYIAAKNGNTDLYDHLRITDPQKEMLHRWINEALDLLATKLRHCTDNTVQLPHPGGFAVGGSTLTLDLPANHNAALQPQMQSEAFSAIVNYTVAKWLGITAKDLAPTYTEAAAANINNLASMSLARTRPNPPLIKPTLGG